MANRGVGLLFNEIDQYVSFGDILGTLLRYDVPFSLGGWIKPADTGNLNVLFSNAGPTSPFNGMLIYYNVRKMRTTFTQLYSSKTIEVITANDVPQGAWFHFLLTYDGSNTAAGLKQYINGVANDNTVLDNACDWVTTSNAGLTIGHESQGALDYWGGGGDEFVIWDKELSQAEVLADYAGAVGTYHAAGANIVAIWGFDSGSGVTAVDRSSNGYDGTLINFQTDGTNWIAGIVPTPTAPYYALSFDGIDEYVYRPTKIIDAYPFSIRVLFKMDTTVAGGVYFNLQSTAVGNIQYGLQHVTNGRVAIYVFTPGSGFQDAISIAQYDDNAWHQLVGIFANATDRKLYIDGNNLVASDVVSALYDASVNSYSIGMARDSTPGGPYKGMAQDIGVYDVGLSGAELNTLWGSGNPVVANTVQAAHLKLYLPPPDGIGSIATDESGNDWDGTLTNMEDEDWVYGNQLIPYVPPTPPSDVDQFKVGKAYRRFRRTRIR